MIDNSSSGMQQTGLLSVDLICFRKINLRDLRSCLSKPGTLDYLRLPEKYEPCLRNFNS
ncbi:MAG: hypothetical protein QOH41_526 [Blastocatellia bacterium]|jgi:hypothetical protein|nr:hypothetical protein [Blastocatellia bacterium]